MIILGADPGSLRTGYGAIESDGRRHQVLTQGVIAPPSRASLPEKLRLIHAQLAQLIQSLGADVLAVEGVFHAANARSALVLGHVRGVVLLAGAQAGLQISEFPPATVKATVTGNGRAEKSQVAYMVARLLALGTAQKPGDATDALAVALCHAHQLHRPGLPA